MFTTLAGGRPAWGEDWGYDRAGHRYFGDASEVLPSREEGERKESAPNLSALLFCVVFWLLIGAAIVLSWIAK